MLDKAALEWNMKAQVIVIKKIYVYWRKERFNSLDDEFFKS